jgi:ActR/RegA family two-component response regulator
MKKKIKIALVEDNRFHAILFERAIVERYPDNAVDIYPSGQACLHALRERPCDLIAIDFHLPDMNGLELLSLVHAEQPDLAAVLITGAGSEQIAAEAIKTGAIDYIAKGDDFVSVVPRIISQAFQKHQLILKNRRLETKARDAEKLEMVTAVASTLNHEINNPLMAVLGNVELLLDDPRMADPALLEKLEMIEKSARRIQDITHQMANLMTTSLRQTPSGPMLKLVQKNSRRRPKSEDIPVPAEKTD